MKSFEGQGEFVAPEDQAINFMRTIQAQAAASGVGIGSITRARSTHTNDAFFVEQVQNINVVATDEQLVDFLYKLGSGASMIRVRDLELQPDGPRQHLNANIRLVASYQKNPTAPGRAAVSKSQPQKRKMKTTTLALILFLTALEFWAQTAAQPAPSAAAFQPCDQRPGRHSTPAHHSRPAARRRPRRASGLQRRSQPPLQRPPRSPEEMIPAGNINFQGVDVNQVLDVYAQLVGRTLLRAGLPPAQIILHTETPLTKSEAIQALQAVLALNGISLVNIGDKFVKVLPVEPGEFGRREVRSRGRKPFAGAGFLCDAHRPVEIRQAQRNDAHHPAFCEIAEFHSGD